ncbi:MAG: flagellar basal-body rod protein FlgC [Paracoccaceae bacterium]|jgi:flagellar basal-body rod protein FlgC
MIGAINTSLSGLDAAAKRIEASASNVANSRNTIRTEDARTESGGADRNRSPPPAYEPVRVYQSSDGGGGTRAEFVSVEPPHVKSYDPGNRLADDDGMVARPNVDYAAEFVNLNQAEHAYSANLKVIATENAMIGALLNEVH